MNTKATIFDKNSDTCPLCESFEISCLYTITKYADPFEIYECKNCSFQFMNPPFSDDYIINLYSKDYYQGSANYSYHDERKIEKYANAVWKKRVEKIHSIVPEGNFLDIGCSFGGLLKNAEKYYTPYGIEVSPYASEHAKKTFGSNIHLGTIETHPFPKGHFSVITMIELLEHVKEPANFLQECYNLLQPGGLLLIQTANMAGFQAQWHKKNYAYYMPGHLSYFSNTNISYLLKKIGFIKTKFFYPVEFGLIPKLKKSSGSFHDLWDYRHWFRISWYHFKSKLFFGEKRLTSSMVLYSFK